jgi:glutaredoxin
VRGQRLSSDKGWIPALMLLVCGIAILVMALAESAVGLPISMPRSWYTSRWIWILVGATGIYYGMRLFARSASAQIRIDERQHVFRSVVLYTRAGCHLCDDAAQILRCYDSLYPHLEVVDIDSSPDLVEQYNTCVPVVEIDGKVRFRGHISEILFKRLIEGTRRKRTRAIS